MGLLYLFLIGVNDYCIVNVTVDSIDWWSSLEALKFLNGLMTGQFLARLGIHPTETRDWNTLPPRGLCDGEMSITFAITVSEVFK